MERGACAAGLSLSDIVTTTQKQGLKDWAAVKQPTNTVNAILSVDSAFVRTAPGRCAPQLPLTRCIVAGCPPLPSPPPRSYPSQPLPGGRRSAVRLPADCPLDAQVPAAALSLGKG